MLPPQPRRVVIIILALLSMSSYCGAAARCVTVGITHRITRSFPTRSIVPWLNESIDSGAIAFLGRPIVRSSSMLLSSTRSSSSSSSRSRRSNAPPPVPAVGGAVVDPIQAQYMEEEMCIGVTFEDKPLKSLSKKEAHLIKGKGPILHRAFSVFLFDELGHLLLQRRADAKITFPRYWTNTCCSHPLHNPFEMGEDVAAAKKGPGREEEEAPAVVGCKRAAIRKLEHELGIPASALAPEELTYMTRIHYIADSDVQWGEHEIDYLFLVQKANIRRLLNNVNPNEVGAVAWVDPAQLRAMLRRAELCRGEPLSAEEEAEEEAEAEEAKAGQGTTGEAIRFTPWSRAIMERFLFVWWDDVGAGPGKDLSRHFDRGCIHRLGRLDP